MRINLIGNFATPGLNQDASILRGLLTNQFPDVVIHRVTSNQPECQEAEVNIFIEVMNPGLLTYAGYNVWIPNPEWTYKTWIPYIPMMDAIWVKTREAEEIFKQHTNKVQAHGREWKIIYGQLLKQFLEHKVFPPVIERELLKSLKNPAASSCAEDGLLRVLRNYDT